jgi:hypothetical protein
MTLSKLDVLHLLMWWTQAQVVEGQRQVMCGSAFLTFVYLYSRHYCLPWLTKYLNLKSKREIVKMPRDGDVSFTDANNISAAQD